MLRYLQCFQGSTLIVCVLFTLTACGQETLIDGAANVRGKDIQVQYDEPDSDHIDPVVTPTEPVDLVVSDCAGLRLFIVNDTAIDNEAKRLTLDWWDPGIKQARSLTILADSPSCQSHPEVRQYFDAN